MNSEINSLLVAVYNDILTIEEQSLNKGKFSDLSITEMHTIEAVGMYTKKTMGTVAKALGITVGTLTIAVNNLVKKGYVERLKSEDDRRVVKVGLTSKGRLLHRVHQQFHSRLVRIAIEGLSSDETKVLTKALNNLHHFVQEKYILK